MMLVGFALPIANTECLQNIQDPVANLDLSAVTDQFGGCTTATHFVKKDVDKLAVSFHAICVAYWRFHPAEELSNGLATVDSGCVRVDCVGGYCLVSSVNIHHGVWRLVVFLQMCAHRKMGMLGRVVKRLFDDVSWLPSKVRSERLIVRFLWNNDNGLGFGLSDEGFQ
jgi:hypothetical protein